ncbi:hypothetical protein BDZ97DRAFT_1912111 [Flammula alnicola]|nr:hypothetical protein BDZ97DRAFT_1912111 [Flammula alnicola]
MDDQPYTTADEDPFSVQPYVQEALAKTVQTVKHKRSSMLDKWITEQQAQSSDNHSDILSPPEPYFAMSPPFASSSNPYLAYPDLPRLCSDRTRTKKEPDLDSESINSYDLVDDDDIPSSIPDEPSQEEPATPIPQRTHKSSRHSITPSFRTISLGFRSNPPSSPSSTNMEAASRALARLSFFPRTPRSSTGPSLADTTTPPQHNRSSSLSTLTFSASHQPTKFPPAATSSKWRPTVLGHFNQSSASQISIGTSEAPCTPSRPSISSGDTYATSTTSRTTTTLDSNIPTTPSKISLFDSIRLRSNKSPKSVSTFSVASTSSVRLSTQTTAIVNDTPTHGTDYSKGSMSSRRIPFAPRPGSVLDNRDNEDDLDPPPTYRFNKHESTRPMIPHSSSGTLNRVKFSSLNSRTHRKKKKLIISGVGVTETRKFEGIKRWCESFGEVRQISRMPNGDLQIDFRDPEVADTVCRVRAKVFIAGVGSVQLSWIAGNKR